MDAYKQRLVAAVFFFADLKKRLTFQIIQLLPRQAE